VIVVVEVELMAVMDGGGGGGGGNSSNLLTESLIGQTGKRVVSHR
jgi:hypothetical protein